MNEALQDNLTTNRDHQKRDFKVLKEDADTIFLTEAEIKTLYEMKIDLPEYKRVRDMFVLNCYTGLRHSDWGKVSKDKIHDGKLHVRTQKTNEPVIIPVKPLVKEILEQYGTIQIPLNQKTNDALRWIGQKAHDKKLGNGNFQKWREIRTHTARRSFATNAYLAGIPMRDIMQIT
ncbi:MAG: tyrosine-type recombinase/integrase, partial [Bacteroidetes bacterium]|nr:tyrosine-type recombinase/integrase [Bacteroidota bacterium]